MDLTYVKEFLVLARICNYSRAADELFISQSSLFGHIKALEVELGVALFIRSGKRIVVSEEGKMFLPYAYSITKSLDNYAKDIEEKKRAANSVIKIGSQYRTTDIVRNFSKIHRNYRIYTMDCYSPEEALYENDCELAFVRNLKDDGEKYDSIIYIHDSMVAVLYRSHPLASRESLALQELKNENFVIASSVKRKENDGFTLCKEAGFVPKVAMTVLNGTEAAMLVNEEFGISLLLRKTIQQEKLENVILVELEPKVKCDVALCWRKDVRLSEGAKQFISYIKEIKE